VEKAVLAKLDQHRIRGRTGRKNEWLEGIGAEEVLGIVLETINALAIPHELIVIHKHRPAGFMPLNTE
jgi:hypothetical protein